MKNVVLIGPPGSGKTTLGALAAEKLGLEFVDTDKAIMAKFKAAYPDGHFFTLMRCYAGLEREVLNELSVKDAPFIVSAGAETPLSTVNASILKQIGFIILLRRDKESLVETAAKQTKFQIVRESIGAENKRTVYSSKEFVRDYFEEMARYEREADTVLDNDSGIEAGLAALIEIIRTLP